MATISNTPRPGYVWDSADNVWYPIGVGAHQHTNAADTPAVMPYSTYAAAGKNKVINGDFGVWQRGTTFNSASNGSFTSDRWQVAWDSSPTVNVTQQTFTLGTAPVTGYEGQYFFRLAETATSSSTVVDVRHKIEDVRTFANQTATLSFWAKADSARTMTIAAINQDFGVGGSTAVTVTPTTSSFNLTTSWQRFSTTVIFPSIAGKTIGTNSAVSFFLRNTASSTLVFDLWGVQFEPGSNLTAFQTATGNPASELAACQRYYQKSYNQSITPGTASQVAGAKAFQTASTVATGGVIGGVVFGIPMRANPTISTWGFGGGSGKVSNGSGTDLAATSASAIWIGETGFAVQNSSGGTITPDYNVLQVHYAASAEL
jgi:hypothetical protein